MNSTISCDYVMHDAKTNVEIVVNIHNIYSALRQENAKLGHYAAVKMNDGQELKVREDAMVIIDEMQRHADTHAENPLLPWEGPASFDGMEPSMELATAEDA